MSAICFRVKSRELARGVGCAGAERIPESRPGRAVSERWGPMQTYYLPKSALAAGLASILDERELALVEWALAENGGYLSLADIERAGLRTGAARRLAEDWERRGWLVKDPLAANKRRITDALLWLSGLQTENPENPANPAPTLQTGLQTVASEEKAKCP